MASLKMPFYASKDLIPSGPKEQHSLLGPTEENVQEVCELCLRRMKRVSREGRKTALRLPQAVSGPGISFLRHQI